MRSASLSEVTAADYSLSADVPVSLKALAVQEVLQRGIFEDEKARDIESYALELHCQANWERKCTLNNLCIDSCPCSKYSDKHRVIRAQMAFDHSLSLPALLALIENPDAREKWDYGLQNMSVLYIAEGNYYVRNSVFLLTSPILAREFVEKCQIREVGTELRLAYYSVNHPVRVKPGLCSQGRYPEKSDFIRSFAATAKPNWDFSYTNIPSF